MKEHQYKALVHLGQAIIATVLGLELEKGSRLIPVLLITFLYSMACFLYHDWYARD